MNSGTEPDEVLIALDLARQLAENSIKSLPADQKAAVDAFMQKFDSLRGDWTALVAPSSPPEKKKRKKKVEPSCPEDFRGKSGKLAKLGFQYLFDHRLVKAGDIAFLLSADSADEFKTRGYPVLIQMTGSDESCAYRGKIRRYAKMKPIESGGARYLVCSQFYDDSVEPTLKWFAHHGLSRAKAKKLIS